MWGTEGDWLTLERVLRKSAKFAFAGLGITVRPGASGSANF